MNRRTYMPPTWLAALGFLASCTAGETVEEVAEHPSVVVTQWNDSTELFLEHPELLAGQAMGNWAIHLSDMTDFKPITEGTLTVRFLRGGAEAHNFTIPTVLRAGIFVIDPVIPEPGSYQVELSLTSPQAVSSHTLPDVRVWANASELPASLEEEAGGISFLKEQQWQIPFSIEAAAERPVSRTVSAPAEIVAPDGALAQVGAPIDGIALAAPNQSAPSVGQRVSQGQLLAVLSPTSGEGGYARALGELEDREREVARSERLYSAGAIPERRLEEARHNLAIAQAEVRAMGGGREVDEEFRLRVVAPIAGVVAERSFVPGGRVEAGDALFTIIDPRVVWLRAHISPSDAASLASDTRPYFTIEGMDSQFQTTRLVSIGGVLDAQTRTVPAVFEAANPGGILKIGQFASASVPIGGSVAGVAIPNEAILDDNGTPVAYVQAGGETFERRALTVGASDALRTQVLEGVRAGEMVVTAGAYQVRLASMSGSSFAGAHAH